MDTSRVGGLTVDVLADIFPLSVAVLVTPLSKAVSHHLYAVFPRLLAIVVGLALLPVSETGEIHIISGTSPPFPILE